jgi:hypothetical protein
MGAAWGCLRQNVASQWLKLDSPVLEEGVICVDVTLHSQWLWVDINKGKICTAARGKCNSQ